MNSNLIKRYISNIQNEVVDLDIDNIEIDKTKNKDNDQV